MVPHCVRGKGRADQHRKSVQKDTETSIPKIASDYFYVGQRRPKEKEERDHQREEIEESTEFGKRKTAGSGRQWNTEAEMRTEQDGRSRWKEKENMTIAWDT